MHLHSFGTLGVIYEMVMQATPEFGVKKCIYADVPWATFLSDPKEFDRLNQDKVYISYFTNWQEEKMNSIWTGDAFEPHNGDYSEWMVDYEELCDATWFDGHLVKKQHPVPGRSDEPCVDSGFGMWNEKIYHFKPDLPPSSAGDEIQSEFFVTYGDMPRAVLDLYSQAELFRDLVQITEIRGVAADTIPLSPAKDKTVFGIHFTWKHDFEGVYFAAEKVQQILAKYDYRVHYGKFFHAD